MDRLPANYAEWKQCIEVDCSIPLTTDFCRRRVEALNNEGAYIRRVGKIGTGRRRRHPGRIDIVLDGEGDAP